MKTLTESMASATTTELVMELGRTAGTNLPVHAIPRAWAICWEIHEEARPSWIVPAFQRARRRLLRG